MERLAWRGQRSGRGVRAPGAAPSTYCVALAPRRVGDVGDHGLDALAVGVEAVVEAHRVEDVADVAQVREQPDRAGGPDAGPRLDADRAPPSASGTSGAPR